MAWSSVTPATDALLSSSAVASATALAAWAATTAVVAGELRTATMQGVTVTMESLSARTTGAALNAGELANWRYVSQSKSGSFGASAAVLAGVQIVEAGNLYEMTATTTTGATFAAGLWTHLAGVVDIVSPDTNTFVRAEDGQVSFQVDGVDAGLLTNDGGVPKWTLNGILDPAAYAGTAQTLVQRDALVATNPLAKAGYLVYVVDIGVAEYQVWSGSAWLPVASAASLFKGSAASNAALIALAKASLTDGETWIVGQEMFTWRATASGGAFQPADTLFPGVDSGWWVKVACQYAGNYSSTAAYSAGDLALYQGKLFYATVSRDQGTWGATPIGSQFSQLPGIVKPQFDPSVGYAVGDLVLDETGQISSRKGIYRFTTAHNNNDAPNSDSVEPLAQMPIYRGEYGAAKYIVGDVVEYQGQHYRCSVPHGSNMLGGPFNPANWTLIGQNRLHLDDTTVAPVVAGAPTVSEIAAAFADSRNVIGYYTGDDLSASAPTYVFHFDNAGAVTLLQNPASSGATLYSADGTIAGGNRTVTLGGNDIVFVEGAQQTVSLSPSGTSAIRFDYIPSVHTFATGMSLVPTDAFQFYYPIANNTSTGDCAIDSFSGADINSTVSFALQNADAVSRDFVFSSAYKGFDGASSLGTITLAAGTRRFVRFRMNQGGTNWTLVEDSAGSPVTTSTVARLSSTQASLSPGDYDLDSSGAAFDITLQDVVGTWNFYNTNRSISANTVTLKSTATQTFTDSSGAQVDDDFVMNISKHVVVLHTETGDDYRVSVDDAVVAPTTFTPNGAWDASTNTPDMNVATNRVSGSTYFVYYVSNTGTVDLGNGPELFEAGGRIEWFSPTVYNYIAPSAVGDTNFANSDLTFTGARTHLLGSNPLQLLTSGAGSFLLSDSGIALGGASGTVSADESGVSLGFSGAGDLKLLTVAGVLGQFIKSNGPGVAPEWGDSPVQGTASSGFLDILGMRVMFGSNTQGITGQRTVTLPAAFLDTDYAIIGSPYAPGAPGSFNRSVFFGSKTTTGCVAHVVDGAGSGNNADFSWIAVGLKP